MTGEKVENNDKNKKNWKRREMNDGIKISLERKYNNWVIPKGEKMYKPLTVSLYFLICHLLFCRF